MANNRQKTRSCFLVMGLLPIGLSLLVCAASPAQAKDSETTTLHGKIVYHGPVPSIERESITKDLEVCGATYDQIPIVMGNEGGLQEVVVSVKEMSGIITTKVDPLMIKND